MILAQLAAAALIVNVATGPVTDPTKLPSAQKTAALAPLVRAATECIARSVGADPRLGHGNLGDLIVDSMPRCVTPVRAMIDGYDRYFGDGEGEAFFMGPYLDLLPAAVGKWVRDAASK